MSDRRKILILSHFYPYAPVSGAAIRIFNIVENLSLAFDIYFMSLTDREIPADEDQLKSLCKEVILVRRGGSRQDMISKAARLAWRYLRIIFCLKDPIIEKHNSVKFRKTLIEWLDGYEYAVTIVESSWMAQYIPQLKDKNSSCKVILDLYDLHSQFMKERIGFSKNILYKFYNWLLYFTMKRFETRCIKMADTIFISSKIEETKARMLSSNSNYVEMPNFISIERYEDYRFDNVVKNSLIFTGWMNYASNESAVIYFYNEILPLIRKKGYSPSLKIVGGCPTKRIRALMDKDPEITVTGFVKDARPFIASSEVFIVPNIEGSGTRVKILEAFAMKKPVVSTPKGCEGINVNDGENILIARSPEEFANAVIRLFNDDNLRLRLAENGRRIAREHYSSSSWRKRLMDIIEDALIH